MDPALDCTDLRERALEARFEGLDALAQRHVAQCVACAAWYARARGSAQALTGLARQLAPTRLERDASEAVSRAMRMQRLAGSLGTLERQLAPAQLDRRIDALLRGAQAADEAHARVPELLGSLRAQAAPHVLERLVREELEQPERQRARRFAGDLERQSAPAALEGRVFARLARERRALGWRAASALGVAAAALLLVSVLPALLPHGAPARESRLRLVQASSLAEIDPMVRSLLDGAAGGRLSAQERL